MGKTTVKLKRADLFQGGDFIKFDHLGWDKVLSVNLREGWVYFKLEGRPKPCSIWNDVELPWHP